MSIHPIDFQGSIVNVQRAEKVQANTQEHNLAIQSHIAQEVKKQIEEQQKQVVFTQETRGAVIRNQKRERDRHKKRKGAKGVKVYTFKKKTAPVDADEPNLDVEV